MASSSSASKPFDVLLQSLQNPNQYTSAHLIKLKKALSTKEKIVNFVAENLPVYHSLLRAMKSLTDTLTATGSASLDDKTDQNTAILRELISVVANLCNKSLACSIELKKYLSTNFHTLAQRILEAGERVDASVKATMLRLLGNLAEYRETASIVGDQSILLDRTALMINDEDKVSEAALRTIRLLSKHKNYIRPIVSSNTAFSIGLLLAKRDLADILSDTNALITLEHLSKNPAHIRDVGRQLAQGQCAEKFLDILFQSPNEKTERWQQLILNIAKISCDFRMAFGESGVKRIVSGTASSRRISLFLSYFANDSWSRRILREQGALATILDRLGKMVPLEERSQIMEQMKSFVYDQESLSLICQRDEITNVCIKSMQYFDNDPNSTCQSELAADEEDQLESAARGDGTPAKTINYRERRPVNRQFYDYSMSPNSCASQSPPSSYSLSPSPSTSPLRIFDDQPPFFDFEDTSSNTDSDGKRSKPPEGKTSAAVDLHKKIISNSIEIFAWQTHQENPNASKFLIDENILGAFIRYIRNGPPPYDRLVRLFRRIFQARLYLNKLLEIRFPQMIVNDLIRQPCLLKRFTASCPLCLERARSGQEILLDFITQVDTSFGIGFLETHCVQPHDERFTYALLNGLILLRDMKHRDSFIKRWRPVPVLMEQVTSMLLEETPETVQNNRLLTDIFGMLSLLVAKRFVNKLIGPAEPYRQQCVGECTLEAPNEHEPQVAFSTRAGGHIISIRKSDLTNTNAYFSGLVGNEFAENREHRIEYVFDEEEDEVDEEDFLKFLHYLAGCREKSCCEVNDSKTCVALLHLSNKYSCTELSEELLRSNGPARRFIDGSNVADFFPVILSSWLYRDRFGYILTLVFFKYSGASQQQEVFSAVAGNRLAIDYFNELVSNFLDSVSECCKSGGYQILPLDTV